MKARASASFRATRITWKQPENPARKPSWSGDRIAALPANLRDAEAAAAVVEQAEQRLGPIDILVNCAGAAKRTPPDELTPQHWREAMDAKYFTYIHLIDPVIKRDGHAGSGVILNIVGSGGKNRQTPAPAGWCRQCLSDAGQRRTGRGLRPARNPRQCHQPGHDPHGADAGRAGSRGARTRSPLKKLLRRPAPACRSAASPSPRKSPTPCSSCAPLSASPATSPEPSFQWTGR